MRRAKELWETLAEQSEIHQFGSVMLHDLSNVFGVECSLLPGILPPGLNNGRWPADD